MGKREFKEVHREMINWPTTSVESLTEITYSDGIYPAWRYEGALKDGTPFSLEWIMPLNGKIYQNFEVDLTPKQRRAIVCAIKKTLSA